MQERTMLPRIKGKKGGQGRIMKGLKSEIFTKNAVF